MPKEEGDTNGKAHLEGSSQDYGPPDPHKTSQGELDADGEEEEDHPDFGQELHFVDGLDEAQAMGPRHDPGEEETQDKGEPRPLEEKDHHQAQAQDDGDVTEEEKGHGPERSPSALLFS